MLCLTRTRYKLTRYINNISAKFYRIVELIGTKSVVIGESCLLSAPLKHAVTRGQQPEHMCGLEYVPINRNRECSVRRKRLPHNSAAHSR